MSDKVLRETELVKWYEICGILNFSKRSVEEYGTSQSAFGNKKRNIVVAIKLRTYP